MNILEVSILNFILVIFPITLYLLYKLYSKTLNVYLNELYFDLSLISSFYLIMSYSSDSLIKLLFLLIPIIISILYKRLMCFIILIIFIIGFIINFNVLNYSYSLLEYIEIVSIFLICVISSCDLLYSSNKILSLYKSIKELEREKQIRESLFKITHEIKNPIAVCKGYLDMFDVNNISHSRKYIPIIKDEINRVLNLLQDFLSITKIKIEKDIVDINMLINDTIAKFELLLNKNKINLIYEEDLDEVFLNIDYNRVSQVLINIIKNSIEAIGSRNDHFIKIWTEDKIDYFNIYILDNGGGISKEDLDNMNKPFFTTKKNGTGLGVYFSREIIKEHGGEVIYKSSNNNTLVNIKLPK